VTEPTPRVELRNLQLVRIDYTNWRGERRWRIIRPLDLFFGVDQWHSDGSEQRPQWFIVAIDVARQVRRHFALEDIHAWESAAGEIITHEPDNR